jgi:hypothetical protein
MEGCGMRDAVNLLQTRSWKAAARKRENLRKEIGEAKATKRAEAPQKKMNLITLR